LIERSRRSRYATFDPHFRSDLRYLVEAVLRDPSKGIGKPEPLKYLGPNLWSRRVTDEHRLSYWVLDDRVDFLQARYHY
jgi:toxin YoeB